MYYFSLLNLYDAINVISASARHPGSPTMSRQGQASKSPARAALGNDHDHDHDNNNNNNNPHLGLINPLR